MTPAAEHANRIASAFKRAIDDGATVLWRDEGMHLIVQVIKEANSAAFVVSGEIPPAPPIPTPTMDEQTHGGTVCSECGGSTTIRTGTCETCVDCGTSVGGCS